MREPWGPGGRVSAPGRLARALPAAGLLLLYGCAGLPRPARGPRAGVEVEPAVRFEQPPGSREVRFDTEPEGAELLIDNRLRGTTPLLLPLLAPGLYKVEARKSGYRTLTIDLVQERERVRVIERDRGLATDWQAQAGAGARYTMTLRQLTGRLTVSVTPEAARLTAGGGALVPGTHELPAGVYRVRATAFGYRDAERTVRVEGDFSVRVDLALEEATFLARVVRVTQQRFDPGGTGDLGRVLVDYEVTAPASGTLRVLAESGVEVYAAALEPGGGPRGSAAWDGRTQAGVALPDGGYLLRLELRSAKGEEAQLEAGVVVARRGFTSLAGQGSGLSGLQYVAMPQADPPAAGAFTLTSALVLAPGAREPVESAPVTVAARYRLPRGIELDAAAGALLVGEPPLPFFLSAGLKQELRPPTARVSLAATARASLQVGSGADLFTAFTGLGLGLAAALQAGPLLIALEPQVTVSPWRVTGDDTYDDDPAFNSWAYLRAGAAAGVGRVTIGLSAAVRTEPFADGPGVAEPLALGAEAHWRPPGSRLALALCAGAHVASGAVDTLLVGTAFSYLY